MWSEERTLSPLAISLSVSPLNSTLLLPKTCPRKRLWGPWERCGVQRGKSRWGRQSSSLFVHNLGLLHA